MRGAAVTLAVALFCATSAVWATPTIVVGSHGLQPNTAGQDIEIFVSGSALVHGIDFMVQVEDGSTGPWVTHVDCETGTIFTPGAAGQNVRMSTFQFVWIEIENETGTSSAAGLIGTVTIDTSGFTTPGQSWDFVMTGTLGGDSEFFDESDNPIATSITNGTIWIVPEPATVVILGLGILGLLLRHRYGHR
jgi:hypothetical protein